MATQALATDKAVHINDECIVGRVLGGFYTWLFSYCGAAQPLDAGVH